MPPKHHQQQRTFLTNAQKLQLKQFWSEHSDMQLPTVVDWVRERFGVSVGRATLYRIYHAPVETFVGNAQQKKGRRVKFPALEKDILTFFEENRRLSDNSGAALSDDALLRAAAELRARHGISDTELKLSNGWLHRFKERHALRFRPHTTDQVTADTTLTVTDTADDSTHGSTDKPKRKPRAPPRRKVTNQSSSVQMPEAESDVAGSIERLNDALVLDISDAASTIQQRVFASASTSNALDDTTDIAAVTSPTAAIQPLIYLSAVATGSVAAVRFVRWKLCNGMSLEDHFSVIDDGVSILRTACYRVNVELQHTISPPGITVVIFKVWAGVELLGQCECSVRNECGRTLSVLQLDCALSAHTVIRVEYHAPGVVYNDSRLVLRLLSEFA